MKSRRPFTGAPAFCVLGACVADNRIRVFIEVDGKRYTAGLQAAERQTQAFTGQVKQSEASVVGLGRSLYNAQIAARAAATGLGLYVATQAALASSRAAIQIEGTRFALQAVTDDAALARAEFALVIEEAERLGFAIADGADNYTKLLAASQDTAISQQEVRDIFSAVNEAAATLQLEQQNVNGLFVAFTQIISKGTVQAEELRGQIGDRLPGAFQLAARAMGVTTAELDSLLQNGQVTAEELLPALAGELRRTFGTDAQTRIDLTRAEFQRFKNEITLTAAAIGDGLNPVLAAASGFMADLLREARGAPRTVSRLREEITALQQALTTADGREAASLRRRLRDLNAELSEAYLQSGDRDNLISGLASLEAQIARLDTLIAQGGTQRRTRRGERGESVAELEARRAQLMATQAEAEAALFALNTAAANDGNANGASLSEQAQRDIERLERKLALVQATTHAERVRAGVAAGFYNNITPAQEAELLRNAELLDQAEARIQAEDDLARAREQADRQRQRLAASVAAEIAAQTLARQSAEDQAFAAAARREQLIAQNVTDEQRRAELLVANEENLQAELRTIRQQAADERARLANAAADAELEAEERAAREREQIRANALGKFSELTGEFQNSVFAETKRGFEASKALSIINATIKTYEAAVAGYNAGLSIGGPLAPALAVSFATAASAFGAAQIAAIQAAEYQGGRRIGGPVSAGGYVEALEGNRPELYEAPGGRFFLMSQQPGQVTPATAATPAANGQGGHITVHNYGRPEDVQIERHDNGDTEIKLFARMERFIASNVAAGGTPIDKALSAREQQRRVG